MRTSPPVASPRKLRIIRLTEQLSIVERALRISMELSFQMSADDAFKMTVLRGHLDQALANALRARTVMYRVAKHG